MAAMTLRSGKWHVRIRQKGYPTTCRSFNLKKDAVAWSSKTVSDMQAGRFHVTRAGDPSIKTFGELLDTYLEKITPAKKGAPQERDLISLLRSSEVTRPLCQKPVGEVRQVDVANIRDRWLASGLKPATVRNRLALISSAFEIGRKEFSLPIENPVRLIRKPRASNERSRVFMDGEVDRIIAATRSDDLPAILTLAVETGMRRGEICALQWERIDLDARMLELRTTKSGAPRIVPLSPVARAVLRDMPRRPDGRVFGLKPKCASGAFAFAVKRARKLYEDEQCANGLPIDDKYLRNLRLHDARHSALSALSNSGWDVLDIAAVSGHSSWQCLKRYVHARTSRLADKLDAASPNTYVPIA